jgi:putative Ca2+/H+ antiporter (TMEM165/GDT1 family)
MLSTVLSTFGIIFIAELPDKTALASLALATRFRVRDVIAGAWLAFFLQTVVAVLAGSVLRLLPARPVHVAAGIGFLAFAVLALRRDEEADEKSAVAKAGRRRTAAWITCFLIIFAAEFGDLTQLATAALVAQAHATLAVAAGAIAALWTATVIAAVTGAQAGRFLTPVLLNPASAALFAVVGGVVIVAALR